VDSFVGVEHVDDEDGRVDDEEEEGASGAAFEAATLK
jgi:hypothetical protein